MTAIIAKCVDAVPGLRLRASDDAEALGMDEDQVRQTRLVVERGSSSTVLTDARLCPLDRRVCKRLYRGAARFRRLDAAGLR